MKPSLLKTCLVNLIEAREPVLIKGAPGIGKSDIVTAAAADAGAELLITHPVVSDPTDVKGLPFVVPNPDTGDSEAMWLPFGDLKLLIETEVPLVCFLDDLGQASPMVQAACMQLILARRINEHKVSDLVTFIAATNRKADKAGVSGILEPVKSRFATILELEVDVNDWIKWAAERDMPEEVISFIMWRKEAMLHDFKPTSDIENTPSPRTVAAAGRLFNLGLPEESEMEILKGACGEGWATEFTAYLEIYRKVPDPELCLTKPDKVKLPSEPNMLYALAGATCGMLKPRGGTKKETDASTKKIEDTYWPNYVKLWNRVAEEQSEEYCVMAVHMATSRFRNLINTRDFQGWLRDYRDYIS